MSKINIRAITWNVGGRSIPNDFRCIELLGGKAAIENQEVDIYIVGFQEVSFRLDNIFRDIVLNGEDAWTYAVRTTLASYNYIKICSKRYLGTVLTVFCLKHHLPHLRDMKSQSTPLTSGFQKFWKCIISDLVGRKLGAWPRSAKAAVSARLEIYGMSFCFVCSHLEAYTYDLDSRIAQYKQIIDNHRFRELTTSYILEHDYVIWLGDLKSRFDEKKFTFEDIVQKIR